MVPRSAPFERIEGVADKVAGFRGDGHDVVVVVSAMSGETNRLMDLAAQVLPEGSTPRELDVLLSTGEQVTTALLSMALHKLGVNARSIHRQPGAYSYRRRAYQSAHSAH